MKLLWQNLAIEDLKSVQNHIALDNPAAAVAVVQTIYNYTESTLTQFPEAGRAGRVEDTRELVIPRLPFIVPYRIANDQVQILAVHHTSRRRPESL